MRGLRTTVLQTDRQADEKWVDVQRNWKTLSSKWPNWDLIYAEYVLGSHGTFIRMNNMLDHKANKI